MIEQLISSHRLLSVALSLALGLPLASVVAIVSVSLVVCAECTANFGIRSESFIYLLRQRRTALMTRSLAKRALAMQAGCVRKVETAPSISTDGH